MPESTPPSVPSDARVCLISFAHAEKNLSRCVGYEFEDVVRRIDRVDLRYLEPTASYPLRKRLVNRSTKGFSPAHRLNPGIRKMDLGGPYDLGVVVCQLAKDLFALNAVRDLHRRCRVTVCWIEEAWVEDLPKYKGHMKLLSRFDRLFTSCSRSAPVIQAASGRPCTYLAPGIDTLRFCPYPDPPQRCIDLLSIGRRSEVTHGALLDLARDPEFFYVYDTLVTKDTETPMEHRDLIANLCKRSRFFLANTAKIDLAEETHQQAEVGYRFFEGAASGTVMIGQAPDTDLFKRLFPWPDAVIPLPFHSTEVGPLLDSLTAQPERIEAVRRSGIAHCLRAHDWAYRWTEILETAGLSPAEGHNARVRQLNRLADLVQAERSYSRASGTSRP